MASPTLRDPVDLAAANEQPLHLQERASAREALSSAKSNSSKSQRKQFWTREEVDPFGSNQDELLRRLVTSLGAKNWKVIASNFKDRTDVQCLHRWQKVLQPNLVKGTGTVQLGSWSNEEDRNLRDLVEKYGAKNWSAIAKQFQGRIGKQCRERWHNHLNPMINKDKWTESEDELLIKAQKQ